MDLWIRSQNKEILQKTNALFIAHSEENLWSIIDNQNMTKYGTYKTYERALEVLGEIDERIMLLNTFSIAKDRDILLALKNALPEEKLQGLAYPYEMPKE